MATFAAAVSANMERMVVPMPQLGVERAIAARQTDSYGSYTDDSYYSDYPTASVDPACQSATETLLALVSDLPTAPDDLESWAEASATAASDSCGFSVPASLASEYSAYSTSVIEWYSSYSSDIEDVIAQCTDFEGDVSDFSICTANDALATGTASGTSGVASVSATTTSSVTKTTGTSSSSSSSSSTKSSSSSSATSAAATAGAAAREVGIVGAVIAGVLGAVVAL